MVQVCSHIRKASLQSHSMRCLCVSSGSFKAPQECRAMLARATTEQSCRSRFQPESSPSGTLCSPLNRSSKSRRRQQNSFRTSQGQAAHANAASLLNSSHGQGQALECAPSPSGHRRKENDRKGTGGVWSGFDTHLINLSMKRLSTELSSCAT